MTATIPEQELEIEFILWEAEDPFDRPCERDGLDCPNVAVYKVLWGPDTDLPTAEQDYCRNTARLCLACVDTLHNNNPYGLVYCARCEQKSGKKLFKIMRYIEPIASG